MNTMEVREILPAEWEQWDIMVKHSPHGQLFHTSSWKAVIDSSYGNGSLTLLGCFNAGRLAGGCVFLDRYRAGIRTAVMPLLTPYAGFLLDGPDREKLSDSVSRSSAVLEALASYLQLHYGLQNLICAPGFDDVRPLTSMGYLVSPRYTYHINLNHGVDILWARLDGHVRRQIKKAEKLNFEICSELSTEEAYPLFCSTFTRRGQKCEVNLAYFREIASGPILNGRRRILVARHEQQLVSFVILLMYKGCSSYALASTRADVLPTGISSLLIWRLLCDLVAEKYEVFDFVGANVASIARFKEGFNPLLRCHFQLERTSLTAGLIHWAGRLVKKNRSR